MPSRLIDPLTLQSFTFDSAMALQFSDPTEWTDYPVEGQLGVTDHAVHQSTQAIIEGIVTDSPLELQGAPTFQRSRRAYEQLLDFRNRKVLLTLVVGLRVVQNMAIEDISVSVDTNTGESVRPRVTLKQIRIVASATVPIPPEILDATVEAGAQGDGDLGKQSPGAPGAETEAAANSLLGDKTLAAAGLDFLGR